VNTAAACPTGIRFEEIEKRYGGLYALRRVSLEIATGECVVLAGRNGAGKTTLLRIAARLVPPSAGKVTFPEGRSAGGVGGSSNALGVACGIVGYVAHATMVYDELTAEENLILFARLLGVPQPGQRVGALLDEVGLSERRGSLVRTFSRGMRQRMAIARALLNQPAVLLLDEPATGLDTQGAAWLVETVRRKRDSGRTVVMSLHGESEIASLATRAIRLDAGAVVADTRRAADFRSVLAFVDA
jgi:ABC-type multidrug transport system ATPase subunit